MPEEFITIDRVRAARDEVRQLAEDHQARASSSGGGEELAFVVFGHAYEVCDAVLSRLIGDDPVWPVLPDDD